MLRLIERFLVAVCCALAVTPAPAQLSRDFSWPDGQVLPHFAAPAQALDAVDISRLAPDEQLTFAALVGHVNRRQPRIALLSRRSEEGRDTWFRTATVDVNLNEPFDDRNRFELIAKYAREVRGAILYDPARNSHVRNLAFTAAGLQ